MRVLPAEDDTVNQKSVVRLLDKQGHSAVVVGTGRAALEALDKQVFGLILMDVQTPSMEGLEATAAIRGRGNGNAKRPKPREHESASTPALFTYPGHPAG